MSQNEYTLMEVYQLLSNGEDVQWETVIGGYKLTEEASLDLSKQLLAITAITRISLAHEILRRSSEEAEIREELKEVDEQQDLLVQLDSKQRFNGLYYMSSLALGESRSRLNDEKMNLVKRAVTNAWASIASVCKFRVE